MPSKANGQYRQMVNYVDQLISIHGRLQEGPGRRHSQDALHRAGVVMIVAAWECYVEAVLTEALDVLQASAGSSSPSWATQAFALRRVEINTLVKKFNTPDATKVRGLFVDSVGFDPWPHWQWKQGTVVWDEKGVRGRLDDWMRVRHTIAHGVPLPTDMKWILGAKGRARLTLTMIKQGRSFFSRLIHCTDANFGSHLTAQYGVPKPW